MKLSKTLGAIVCASALAMATAVPAFASTEPTVSGTSSLNAGSGATEVSGFATNHQIVATVPMTASVFMPVTSGAFIAVPSSSAYCIENKGNTNIKVTGITGAAVDDTKFKLVEAAATDPGENQVYMTVTPKGGKTFNVLSTATAAFKSGTDDFGVPANDKVELTLGGGINVVNDTALSEANTYKLVNITYTVEEVTSGSSSSSSASSGE